MSLESTAVQLTATPKKTYISPVLVVFGPVATLTQTSAVNNASDDGSGGTDNSVP